MAATIISTTVIYAGTGSPIWNPPGDTLNGDWMYLFIATANQAVSAPYVYDSDTFATVLTWAAADAQPGTGTAGGTTAVRLTLFKRKFVDGIDNTYSEVILDPGDHMYAVLVVVRGADATTPSNAIASDTGASGTAVSIPGLTTTADNCLVLAAVANATDTASSQGSAGANASLSGLTLLFDGNTTQGNGSGITIYAGTKAVAGAVSATTLTLATASVQARIAVAIAPPPAANNTVRNHCVAWH